MSKIEAGRYAATIENAAVTETPNGKAQVSFDLRLETGDLFTGNKSLEGGAYAYTLNALRAFGFNDDWETLGDQLNGRECSVVIELEPGQKDPSKLYPKLAFINPPRAAGKPAQGGLLARLRAQAKTIPRQADAPPPNPKTAPRSAPVNTPTQKDDGDPF